MNLAYLRTVDRSHIQLACSFLHHTYYWQQYPLYLVLCLNLIIHLFPRYFFYMPPCGTQSLTWKSRNQIDTFRKQIVQGYSTPFHSNLYSFCTAQSMMMYTDLPLLQEI